LNNLGSEDIMKLVERIQRHRIWGSFNDYIHDCKALPEMYLQLTHFKLRIILSLENELHTRVHDHNFPTETHNQNNDTNGS